MTRALLVAALLVGTSGVAAAGPYAGLGIGPSPSLDDDNWDLITSGRTGRFLAGYRLGRISIEGAITVNSATDKIGNGRVEYDVRHLSLAGKYNFPLSGGFEVFGKAGLLNSNYSASYSSSATGSPDADGSSLFIGGGAEYVAKVGVASVSVFLSLEATSNEIESAMWGNNDTQSLQSIIGVTVGM
ncbi:MAG: outer membrane beta-barrel protein [Kofleriaceae bacterium]